MNSAKTLAKWTRTGISLQKKKYKGKGAQSMIVQICFFFISY